MSAVELSEKLLADAGGWQAMKTARALCEAGRVLSAEYAPPLLSGRVQDAGKEFRAGLKITSRTNIENTCSCRASKEWGTVCAHSLAVGLAVLRTPNPGGKRAVASNVVTEASPDTGCAVPSMRGPHFSTESGAFAVLHVVLQPNFAAAWERGAVTAVIEAEVSEKTNSVSSRAHRSEVEGSRVLLQALDTSKAFRIDEQDLQLVERVRQLNGGELAGMLMLPREKFIELAQALRGHPRVTFGKTKPVNVAELLNSLGAPSAGTEPGVTVEFDAGEPKFSLALEGSLNHLAARLNAAYGERVAAVGTDTAAFTFPDPKNPAIRLARNFASESAALERLRRAGFAEPDARGEFVLKGERAILRFFAAELPHLQREWNVSIGSRFTNVTQTIERITPRLDVQSSGENWFELSVHLETGSGDAFSAVEIQRLLQMGQNHTRLKNGRVAVFDTDMLDELQHALVDCDPSQRQPGVYRIDRAHAGYVDAVVGEGARITGDAAWQKWTRVQRQLDQPESVPLGALETVLRPYQKEGVAWMNFLARNGFGGILADEMGLGKTLQALAFIKAAATPAMIVCPSSLVYNWQREAERFTPELRVLALVGAKRDSLFAKIADAQIVVTSYALLRRDLEQYRGHEFRAVFLDEAQHIKNPETQNAQAATGLRAETRFVLTGTPVENSVRDLWSIAQFLMPGYLGGRDEFRERYEQPINTGDASAQQRLAKRIRPFMLRRTKKIVATDLPDKIEQVIYCELNSEQQSLYTKLLNESRRQINETSGTNAGQRKMLMLTALLRLRQACCDLRLLDVTQTSQPSGKVEALDELFRESIDGGHRVLVFSQFVSMLRLIREQLDQAEVPYCYLDGATRDRGREVDRFQQNAEIPVFLISLKAGGVGLNLTAADTVIHFDPWWNPAVEAQATDRAHRIGQKKVVTAYKLIARGTIEEKILALQKRKRELIDATVESEEPMMSSLTMDEIESLLE